MSFLDWLLGTPKLPSEKSADELDSLMLNAVLALASEGDARAQYGLALRYRDGTRVKKSAASAFDWAQRSAAQGYPDAQHFLGHAYETGQGCAQDYDAAVRWHLLASSAAPSGPWDAACRSTIALGFMYANGRGPEHHAQDVLMRLQRYNNVLAHLCTGIICAAGYGVERNLTEAARSFLKVVELDAEASATFEAGSGVQVVLEYVDSHREPVDFGEVRDWLEWAASEDIADAQLAMALVSFYGWRGTERNKKQYRHWLQRSAASGSERAVALLNASTDER